MMKESASAFHGGLLEKIKENNTHVMAIFNVALTVLLSNRGYTFWRVLLGLYMHECC